MTKVHQGKIIKAAIIKTGMPFSIVSSRMHVSRSTLYSRFKQEELDDRFLIKLGIVIKYDFSSEFPHLEDVKDELSQVEDQHPVFYSRKYVKGFEKIKDAYLNLLKFDKKVLSLLTKMANKNEDKTFKEYIDVLLKEMDSLENNITLNLTP